MPIIITLLLIFIVLVLNELWWRYVKQHSELSRKFIHITVGSFVAFWPFYMSWNQIRIFSIAFLIIILISKKLTIFKAIHSVQRPTLGEIYFALSVGILTYITHDPWIYMSSLLIMSLADGLAAIIGVSYGGTSRYQIFGQYKSIVGTVTFFITTIIILAIFNYFSPSILTILAYSILACCLTLIENIGIKGLDNLLVPLFASLYLQYFIH